MPWGGPDGEEPKSLSNSRKLGLLASVRTGREEKLLQEPPCPLTPGQQPACTPLETLGHNSPLGPLRVLTLRNCEILTFQATKFGGDFSTDR